jgi:hypothetical protein
MLTANKIVGIIILVVAIMLTHFIFQLNQLRHHKETVEKLEQDIAQATLTFQPFLQQGAGNFLAGILTVDPRLNAKDFYSEFNALTHIQVQGLWLKTVEITRNPVAIKITGAMNSPDKLDQLLKQLSLQAAFKNVNFIGMNVEKGFLLGLPSKYQEQAKAQAQKIKMPNFYNFVIQTTALNQQEKYS